MAKNCNTSPFYLQGQSPTIQNQVAIIERFLKKQLPNYAVITVSLNGVDIPKDELGNVNLEIERINYAAGDGISIDDNVISCTITDTTYTAGENISIDENNVISTTVIDDSTQSNKSTWSSNKINSLIQEFNKFTITVVNQLPVSGEPYVLYLVGNGSEEQSNVKDEYLWIVENNVGRWEKIGTTQITILQSDWHQSDTTAQDYIKNKPTDLVHTSDIEGLLRNDGTVYTGKYLEQVQDLDNFQASEGKIVQYIGETNSKYTNGYVYKKVVEQKTIPAGTDYITVNYSNKLQFDKVGIYNGIYYKTDKTDEISSQIIEYDLLFLLNNGGDVTYRTSTNSYIVPYVYAFYYKDNSLYFAKINSVEYQTINNILYPDKITFETGDVKYCYSSLAAVGHYNTQGGQTLSESEIVIFENLNGDKIYCRKINDKYKLLVLNKIGSTYKVANPDTNTFIYEYYTTSTTEESIIIENVTKWQQWDAQPREDTSHYVTDSEIGWIEH